MSTPHLARMQRLARLTAKPKPWLVLLASSLGCVGGIHPLDEWSNHELAVEILNLEQKADR